MAAKRGATPGVLLVAVALLFAASAEASGVSSVLRKFLGNPPKSQLKSSQKSARLAEWNVNIGPSTYSPPGANGCGPMRVNPPQGTADEPGTRTLLCASPDIGHYAGYFKLNGTHDSSLFYFYFESRSGTKDTDPLVLWMTGGPGCSSEVAVFFENGPFIVNNDNTTLSWNPYGWDKISNIIYVDQPVNTGFSYSHDPRDMRHDENGVSQDMYEFMQEFIAAHPELADRPLFITGESYGGHYIPAVAFGIFNGNKNKQGKPINLQGIAIGNGLTHPGPQFSSYPDFALANNLIDAQQHKVLRKAFLPCGIAAKTCGEKGFISCYLAFVICGQFWEAVYLESGSGHLNPYDVREDCISGDLCYDMSAADKFLAIPSVRESMGIPDDVQWESCSREVYMAMLLDFMRDIQPKVPVLLEGGVRVLVYAGEKDFICNWLGNWRWVRDMPWSGQDAFVGAPHKLFRSPSNTSWGESVEAGKLTYLKVFEAGHMVPMNQPEASLEMLFRFTRNKALGETPVKSSFELPELAQLHADEEKELLLEVLGTDQARIAGAGDGDVGAGSALSMVVARSRDAERAGVAEREPLRGEGLELEVAAARGMIAADVAKQEGGKSEAEEEDEDDDEKKMWGQDGAPKQQGKQGKTHDDDEEEETDDEEEETKKGGRGDSAPKDHGKEEGEDEDKDEKDGKVEEKRRGKKHGGHKRHHKKEKKHHKEGSGHGEDGDEGQAEGVMAYMGKIFSWDQGQVGGEGHTGGKGGHHERHHKRHHGKRAHKGHKKHGHEDQEDDDN